MKLPLESLASPQLIKPPCQVLPDSMPFTSCRKEQLHLVGRKKYNQAILRKCSFLSNSFLICFQMYCTPQFSPASLLRPGSSGGFSKWGMDDISWCTAERIPWFTTSTFEQQKIFSCWRVWVMFFHGKGCPLLKQQTICKGFFYVSTSLWGMNYWSVDSKWRKAELPHHDVSNCVSSKLRYVGGHEEEASTTFFTNHLRDGAIRNEDYLSLGNIFGFSWSSEPPGCCCTWFKSPFWETQTQEGVFMTSFKFEKWQKM